MPADLSPAQLVNLIRRGRLGMVYLFYGPDDFQIERVLGLIRETLIPESAMDFNLQTFYGDKSTNPADIIDSARSFPFMASNRLIIVRRTEEISASALEAFLPYLDNPVESTCLIFITSRTDFKTRFYKRIRSMGGAVNFRQPYDNQVVPWIKRMAKELGLTISEEACVYLQGIVGSRLREINSELEKLSLRHGTGKIGVEEVKGLAIYSRVYTIFELMDQISLRQPSESISVLSRYMEEEGKDAVFGLMGMLNRQIRLIMRAKSIAGEGGQVAGKLGVPPFLAKKIVQQSQHWSLESLENALDLLYRADGRLKSGARPRLVLENLVLSF
ncbi:MAG: DNA polymerase III subunit delta [Deltaproteobacteria bacterium]|nr:DNA polymerase III subunit delta [Deltaproteobacteria bacterium]